MMGSALRANRSTRRAEPFSSRASVMILRQKKRPAELHRQPHPDLISVASEFIPISGRRNRQQRWTRRLTRLDATSFSARADIPRNGRGSTFAGSRTDTHSPAAVWSADAEETFRRSKPPGKAPPTDPSAGLTPANRFTLMNTLIGSLCPKFMVDSTGEVVPSTAQSLDRGSLAAGSNSTGCCCLSILTEANQQWTI
jgi:hypothetical protein